MGNKIDPLFDSHVLNADGKTAVNLIAADFTLLLHALETCKASGREWALVRTKLEEAKFFAVRAVALQPQYQEGARGSID